MASAETRSAANVDESEVARFAALAAEWWDPEGPFAPLHRLNPVRLAFIRDALVEHLGRAAGGLKPLSGLAVLDIGCGGGLVAESLTRLGATVVGIDAAEETIRAARAHADDAGLAIDYRPATAESLVYLGLRFDAVLALEIIEHVPDRAAFIAAAAQLMKPDGILILSTLNRTAKAFALAIVAGEYLLGWLPRGTHRWSAFVRPSELAASLRQQGLKLTALQGLVFDARSGDWRLARDLSVNYFACAVRVG